MEQQEINNEFYPPLHSFSSSEDSINTLKQRNQFNAEKRQRQLHKHMYTHFPPYQQYFNSRATNLTLYKSKPKFQLHSNLWDRHRLTLERQSMYYRGAVDEFLSDEALKPFVEESSNEKGFAIKRRNKSVVLGDVLYYAQQQCIKAIQLPRCRNQDLIELHHQVIQPMEIFKFEKACTILQLQLLQNHSINMNNEGTILMIRFARKIIIFGVDERKIIYTLSSKNEFLQISTSIYTKNSLQAIEYDGSFSILQQYDLQSNNDLKAKIESPIKTQRLVNGCIPLNRNETLLSKYQGLSLLDKRTRKQISFYEVKNLSKQRLYSSIALKGLYNYSPLIACCQSRYVSIFDIRKPNQMMQKSMHHCQQAPPEVMTFYDGNLSAPLSKPILICHSPYQFGSSIFASIDSEGLKFPLFQSTNLNHSLPNPVVNSHYNLLYDNGKPAPGSGLHSVFNESVSAWNYSPQNLFFFNIDNQGTINMQLFKLNEFTDRYQVKQVNLDSQTQLISHQKIINPAEQWLQQNIKDKYFTQQTYYQKVQTEKILQKTSIPKNKKKATKKNKTKDSKKLTKKLSQQNQSLTNIGIQEFVDGEYQDSQDCQESFAKRKINFADLSKFYSTLQRKGNDPKQSEVAKHNHFDSSLNSTQPNSQCNIFTQSFTDDSGVKAFSFHNKKLMNFSILDKLKNEWDK